MLMLSMTETLFGGLLLAALLFFSSRRLGLSGFWAAVLSGLLPFGLYLAYSSQHWPGGDVLAIHFAVYLANAGLLFVFGGMQRHKQKMHWAPRLIIAFFMGLVVLNAVLLSIASHGLPGIIADLLLPPRDTQKVYTAFPGVVPHDKNKSYEPHLQQVIQQQELGWQAELQGLQQLRSRQASPVTLQLSDRNGKPISQAEARIELWRMANSRDDQTLALDEASPGVYQTRLRLPDAGRWVLILQINHADGSYRSSQQLFLEE
ncbi:FixH family protein [Pseudomethylobacillus aquaticus]|nr:FixH family protein [Pseudomethylobacillus aquaticus]